ncbi:hypothetical protein BDN70DRAFT_842193 [Pholiota conissans]|uniref:Heterokaryon incompatibility domain-containing protein n=1 Tax=Pholiota conissans TaxID=109636 RepID=A0A9P6CWD6_9AGAR|nr:hypothetical protein BDN70DRAFT_842193 [Pholiota conissans]
MNSERYNKVTQRRFWLDKVAELDVDQLPSETASTSKKEVLRTNRIDGHADALVDTLTEFILPLIHAQMLGSEYRHARYKEQEAQQFIEALENFVISLAQPSLSQRDDISEDENGEAPGIPSTSDEVLQNPKFGFPLDDSSSITLLSDAGKQPQDLPPEQPQLLRLALDETRYRVFNRMPIRMLAFNADGSGLQLLERGAIWDRVSTLMVENFNEDEIKKITRRRVLIYGEEVNKAESAAFEEFISMHARYAILSHTWLHDTSGEVTYANWKKGNFDTNSPGYEKLIKSCKVAAEQHGITLAWMDTICINKDSSAELDESIRSMYKWYRDSSVCITYLAQTTHVSHIRDDLWFTRGWTLQELLAPHCIKFYGADWRQLASGVHNDKEDNRIQKEVVAATTITSMELQVLQNQGREWANIPISRKMQWAANRRVTREEDTAYSLMGIFDVSISIAYREGAQRAFFRLVQQILNSSLRGVQDIINWGYGTGIKQVRSRVHPSALIPSSPKQYLWRCERNLNWLPPSVPITSSHLGLHLSILLMPALSVTNSGTHTFYPIGNYYVTVNIDEAVVDFIASPSIIYPGQRYNVLEVTSNFNAVDIDKNRQSLVFGVLNFTTTESMVRLPFAFGMTCFAVCLYFGGSPPAETMASGNVWLIRTSTGVAFDLQTLRPSRRPWMIPKRDLEQHGMLLLDMYL